MGSLSRREFLSRALTGASAGALAASGVLPAAQASAATGHQSKALWGAFVAPKGAERIASVKAFEDLIGRRIDLTRHYLNFDRRLVNDVVEGSVATGHIPLIGMVAKKTGGGSAKFRDIAAGRYDTELDEKGKSLRDLDVPVFFVFNPEPENDHSAGTASEFKDAYRHIREIFTAAGATKLRWMATLMRGTYHGHFGGPKRWFPADADIVGADGYNRGDCSGGGWVSFRNIFTAAHEYAKKRGKPLFIEEWGSVEGTACGGKARSHDKATWIKAAGETILGWPELIGVCYSQTRAYYAQTGKTVDFRVQTSERSLRAYRRVGLSLPTAGSTLCHIHPSDHGPCDPVALH
jgi:hypothetical protein